MFNHMFRIPDMNSSKHKTMCVFM